MIVVINSQSMTGWPPLNHHNVKSAVRAMFGKRLTWIEVETGDEIASELKRLKEIESQYFSLIRRLSKSFEEFGE